MVTLLVLGLRLRQLAIYAFVPEPVFGMPEVKVGVPSVVEAALLPGLIGLGRTRRFLYLAENIHASVAETCGLVDRVVEDEKHWTLLWRIG